MAYPLLAGGLVDRESVATTSCLRCFRLFEQFIEIKKNIRNFFKPIIHFTLGHRTMALILHNFFLINSQFYRFVYARPTLCGFWFVGHFLCVLKTRFDLCTKYDSRKWRGRKAETAR